MQAIIFEDYLLKKIISIQQVVEENGYLLNGGSNYTEGVQMTSFVMLIRVVHTKTSVVRVFQTKTLQHIRV